MVRKWVKKALPELIGALPDNTWKKKWVAWCKYWGCGKGAVLDYLGRYVHRIAITNARILAVGEKTVTFRYKERKQNRWRTCTLDGHEFLRRFLQHVLPKGLHKVRYCGLWNPRKRGLLDNTRIALQLAQGAMGKAGLARDSGQSPENPDECPLAIAQPEQGPACPHCGRAGARCLASIPKGPNPAAARASPEHA